MKRFVWIGTVLIGLCVGYVWGWLAPHRSLRDLRSVKGVEIQRLTDPSQQFDAVLLQERWGGPVGEVNWYVCIVAKGQPASSAKEAILVASDIRQPKLMWRQAHLLEFQYGRAMILDFTNLWSSNMLSGNRTFSGGDPYWIEFRLAPSGPSSFDNHR